MANSDNEDIEVTIQNIALCYDDVGRTKKSIATVQEQLTEEIEGMSEFSDVEKLAAELAEAKNKLRLALLSNHRHNDLAEELADLKLKLKDQKQILSDHIVAYYAMTKERQIEIGTDGDARELILSGKLGAAQKYQTSLLAGADDV